MTGIIDPALFGMPDATTTGVPAGTTLTAYTGPMTITTPGTVIEGKIISGTLKVTAADVTIKNCVVQNYGTWGIDAEGAANITVQNCDFTASSSMDTNAAILGSGTFIGNDISNSENGIVLQSGASVVRDNYIHDLGDNFGDPHIDGISVQGGQNHVLIEHNTVESWDTSAIFIKNDFGPINDITVRNNLLYGDLDRGDPAATIYVYGPNTTNVSITNNYVEKGTWYYYSTSNANPTISGNIEWNNKTDVTPYPNSPPPPATGSVSINNVTISEGDSGTKVATFTATRSGGTAAFDVNFATSNGTATVADSDYVAASTTLHFGANENTELISVTINGDTKMEANETFNVVLSNATNGATISDSQGVGTITNDDAAAIAGSVSINNVTISEDDSGTKVATFTATRSGGTAAFDVNFATSNGTATVADSDYVAASTTLHFGANENTELISVTINGDTKMEANETFNVVLSNATNGATISDSQGVGTITNDDAAAIAGSVSINNVTISEDDSGTKVATFTATRSGGTAAFDVNFATSNGTATVADSDYVAASTTLHFGANENTELISVTINGDTKMEANETFNVVLSNATNGATISDSQGVGTITNDDAAAIAGSVSINNVTISEDDSGTKVATFTATRSGGTAAFDVNFATSNGTATVADSDYVAASTTLHFGANENTELISVTINGDTKMEANETFNVVLSNATNGATISDSQGVGTITNDDGASDVTLIGTSGRDTLRGGAGDDTLNGEGGDDWLYGNDGDDTLIGGSANDQLFGGAGADVFVFTAASDSTPGYGQRDLIWDFQAGIDEIDLSAIDARTGESNNQSFEFMGEGTFDSDAAQPGLVKFHYDSAANRTLVEGTVDSSAGIDFQISLIGQHVLTAADFML